MYSTNAIAGCRRQVRTSFNSMPRVAKTLATASPILLFGVLAPGGEADADRSRDGEPVGGHGFTVVLARRPIADAPGRGVDRARGLHVVGRHALGAQRGERDGIARVVAADDDHDVQRLREELAHGVLALLRRAADRVERPKILLASRRAARALDGPTDFLTDRERFAREHRRLVRHADATQVQIGVETRRRRVRETSEQRVATDGPLDEIADDARLFHVAHHEVTPLGILEDLRCRRARLFVVILPVNERREAIARVALDALPDVEHRSARRVHEHAADRAKSLEILDRHAERRKNHDVVGLEAPEVEDAVGRQENLDPHLAEAGVDVRVVDDLADEEQASVRELAASLVRVLDGALDAVAEAELAREAHGDVSDRKCVCPLAEEGDELTFVVRGEVVCHLGAESEAFAVIGRGRHAWNLAAAGSGQRSELDVGWRGRYALPR
jgi:hypothetical protein